MKEFLLLLKPTLLSLKNRLKKQEPSDRLRGVFLIIFGIAFWIGVFVVFYKVLTYFQGIELIGNILANKLFSMIFLIFLSILVFSNILTSLSTYFLSEELGMVLAMPISVEGIYYAKYFETIISSSWMVLLFAFPIFISYGFVYHGSASYYLLTVATLIPFLMIPSGIGIIFIMVVVNIFPVRKTRDILFLLSIFFIIAIYTMFRFLQPEKLVDPDAFNTIMDYISALRMPDSQFSPHIWVTQILMPILIGARGDKLFNILLLWSSALAIMEIGKMVSNKIYLNGITKAHEAKRARISRTRIFDFIINLFARHFHSSFGAMFRKDIKIFFRDTTQWSQLLLIGALVIVYIYNFKVLPLDRSPLPTFYLQNLISFLNLGLAGFVLSAITVRFVFPAVSIEGGSFWLLRSSPLSAKRLLWSKFWSGFIPLLILGEILVVVSNRVLHSTQFMMILSIITIFLMTFGITSIGVGLGAIYPRFNIENVAKIPMSFGGLMHMILSMSFIGLVILFEAWPVYVIFMSKIKGLTLGNSTLLFIVLSFLSILVLNILAFVLPMKMGIKSLNNRDF